MPAILSHRAVTLHPKIHGGLLALDTPEHLAELEKYGIPWIDMVCVDFYPLEDEILNENATREAVIEKTDIGGPTMIRSGAKGGRITICDAADRTKVIEWIKAGEHDREEFLNDLSAKRRLPFLVIAQILECFIVGGCINVFLVKKFSNAYGENAYQKPAGLYYSRQGDPLAIQIGNL